MTLAEILVLHCACGRRLEVPATQREGVCVCGRRWTVVVLRNDDLRAVEAPKRG